MGFLLKLLVWVLDLSKIWFGPRFIPVNFTKYFRKAFQIKPRDAYRKINDSLLFHTGATNSWISQKSEKSGKVN